MNRFWALLFGVTIRERIANGISYALVCVVAILAVELKWAMKSPTPAQWNYYSEEANSHLYSSLNSARPVPHHVVSHRAGSIPGLHEPSPIDRLDYNYGAGQRLFELDFAWTSDDHLVVKHDWNERDSVPTLDQFLSEAPNENASIEMVYAWLVEHPDAFIVTDCKKRSLEGCARIRMERPDLVPQFIPQIYQFKDYDLLKSQGFEHIILTLYRCLSEEPAGSIAEFVRTHPLFALTIPQSRVRDTQLLEAIKANQTPVYVHTINNVATYAEFSSQHIHGIYSDDLRESDVAKIARLPELGRLK